MCFYGSVVGPSHHTCVGCTLLSVQKTFLLVWTLVGCVTMVRDKHVRTTRLVTWGWWTLGHYLFDQPTIVVSNVQNSRLMRSAEFLCEVWVMAQFMEGRRRKREGVYSSRLMCGGRKGRSVNVGQMYRPIRAFFTSLRKHWMSPDVVMLSSRLTGAPRW